MFSDFFIEALTRYKNMTWYGNFPRHGIPGIKMCRKSCRNPGYGNFPGCGNFPGFGSSTSHTVYHKKIREIK